MDDRIDLLRQAVKQKVMGCIDYSKDISDEEMYEIAQSAGEGYACL